MSNQIEAEAAERRKWTGRLRAHQERQAVSYGRIGHERQAERLIDCGRLVDVDDDGQLVRARCGVVGCSFGCGLRTSRSRLVQRFRPWVAAEPGVWCLGHVRPNLAGRGLLDQMRGAALEAALMTSAAPWQAATGGWWFWSLEPRWSDMSGAADAHCSVFFRRGAADAEEHLAVVAQMFDFDYDTERLRDWVKALSYSAKGPAATEKAGPPLLGAPDCALDDLARWATQHGTHLRPLPGAANGVGPAVPPPAASQSTGARGSGQRSADDSVRAVMARSATTMRAGSGAPLERGRLAQAVVRSAIRSSRMTDGDVEGGRG